LKYVDIPALGEPMALALGLTENEDTVWLTEDARLYVLARLRDGAGVSVITSPRGGPFWSLASTEVEVHILPDDYIWKERNELRTWSFRAAGCTTAETGQLSKRLPDKPPTTAHKLYSKWLSAESLRGRLPQADAQVVQDWDYERLTASEAAQFLTTSRELVALDYEWNIETGRPFDLGIYDGSAYHVPILPGAVEGIRRAVSDRLRAGLPTVWHGGRADLGKQYDADPEELIERPPHDTMINGVPQR
jgi:hypothetical protein